MEWTEWVIKVLYLVLIFVFGFASAQLLNSNYGASDGALFSPSQIALSPPDHIESGSIQVYSDRVVLPIAGARVTNYADTESMIPVFDSGSNGIVVTPLFASEVGVGDIVSYSKNGETLVHRVIEKGEDDEGVYFLVKGDNSQGVDEIRFAEISGVLVGIIY